MDGKTGRHIILPLGRFDPMAFGGMRCKQLQAAWMIAKTQRERLERQTDRRMDKEIDRKKEI